MAKETPGKLGQWALSLLRIVTGFVFMQHGAMKLFGWLGGMGPTHAHATFPDQMWIAGVIEFFGGLLILIGLFTIPAAFIAAGEMAVAYFKAHAHGLAHVATPATNGGEPAVLYCFIFLLLCAAGAGPLSLDRMIWGKRR